jgi:antitoxin HigA-1
MTRIRPIHPGEILREDFLPEYGLTAGSLAKSIEVPRDRMEKIIREKRAVTADTAARLAHFFGTTPQFWMNLQANHDLERLEEADRHFSFKPAAIQPGNAELSGFSEGKQTDYNPGLVEFSEWSEPEDEENYKSL